MRARRGGAVVGGEGRWDRSVEDRLCCGWRVYEVSGAKVVVVDDLDLLEHGRD